MHYIEIPDTGMKRYIPENLAECDEQQYIHMCELLFKYHTGQISEDDFFYHAVYKLMNMVPKESKDGKPKEKYYNVVLIQELIESTFFTKEENTEGGYKLNIIQNYIHNPIPTFKLWQTYYGPSDSFQNMKIGEYTAALKLFLQFNASGDIDLLYELAATLYRRKKWFHFILKRLPKYDGDCRQLYNVHNVEKRIKTMKYAPIGFIYGIYLYFASMQIIVSSAEVPWGDKVLDFSILFSGSDNTSKIEAADIGLDSVIFAMSESGAFGDFEKVNQAPFWNMMIKMYDSRVKQLQLEKQQEDANSQSPS